jgi:SAM-dependent MidA family methyltransferase
VTSPISPVPSDADDLDLAAPSDEGGATGSAASDIAAAIDAAGGALRFDQFMETALYGPHGFYAGAGRAGRRGDFLTSPEVGPLFGAVLAGWIEAEYERLGRPDEFEVVEVGAGPGTLARSVIAHWRSIGSGGHPYTAVEVGPSQRADHPAEVTSIADLGERAGRPIVGVVIANELLDNLPFRLLVFDGTWRESFVVAREDDPSSVAEVLRPLVDVPRWLPATGPHGARVPWQQSAAAWVDATVGSIGSGRLLAIDYVTARTAELSVMPWRAWLRTYRDHRRGDHYLTAIGQQDITGQVALDQLPVPDVVRTQAQFLQRWGLDDLVEEGRQAWSAAASAPTVAAMKMRSRVREAEALIDPDGLGGYLALEWQR